MMCTCRLQDDVSAWLEETQKQLAKVSSAVATVLAATENAVHTKKALKSHNSADKLVSTEFY